MFRNTCITINNYSVDDIVNLLNIGHIYVIVGFEYSSTGTPHMQVYLELLKRTRLETLKKRLPTAHFEHRMGSQDQAIEYCKKEGNYIEDGNRRDQGHRSDLDTCRKLALEGGMQAVTAHCNFQGIRVAEKFLSYNESPRNWKPLVVWLYGPTGTGKSKMAREILESDDIYTKNSATKWWDGYDGHENVIIDDFRPSWWDITYMLGLLDRYEFQVEFKGGLRQFRARKIIVTSALPPRECYKGTGEAIDQLVRRVDIIEEFVPIVPEVGGVILDPPIPHI